MATSKKAGARKRCPRERRPLRTPAKEKSTTSLPASATSHCTGRPKGVSRSDQRIDLRKGIAAHTSARSGPISSRVGLPFSTRRPAT